MSDVKEPYEQDMDWFDDMCSKYGISSDRAEDFAESVAARCHYRGKETVDAARRNQFFTMTGLWVD